MGKEKNALEEVVASIQELLGFGNTEDITGAVNGILSAEGDENKIVTALKGLFGKAISADVLVDVVKTFLGGGKGIDLGNILQLFQGIGDKIGGFDTIAGLTGLPMGADRAVDAVKDAAEPAADAAAAAASKAADATKEAKTDAADTVKQVAAEPARKKKKWPVVLGVIAAILVLAGIGMWTWHEQPSFCGAICHTSMDAYLETYDQEDNAEGIDKYGNAVSNTHAMLVQSHKSNGVACLNCHIPALDQQLGEMMETITGNYTVVQRAGGNGFALKEVSLAELQEHAHQPNESGTGDEFCLRSGCHDMERADLAKLTGSMEFNPHACPHTEFACSDCHKSHRASTLVCTQCHAEAKDVLPDGWLSFTDSEKAMSVAA